jgi:CBS domain-containing protein
MLTGYHQIRRLNISSSKSEDEGETGTYSEADHEHAVISTFDLFSIGIGPSSSHTVGPMRAGNIFVADLDEANLLHRVHRIRVSIYGSLALTGEGHMTPSALLLGLESANVENVDTAYVPERFTDIKATKKLFLGRGIGEDKGREIDFDYDRDFIWEWGKKLPLHSNGMRFTVFDEDGFVLATNDLFSVGGGFVVNGALSINPHTSKVKSLDEPSHDSGELQLEDTGKHPADLGENLFYKEIRRSDAAGQRKTGLDIKAIENAEGQAVPVLPHLSDGDDAPGAVTTTSGGDSVLENGAENAESSGPTPRYPFHDAASLLALCHKHNLTIAQLVYENEKSLGHTDEEIYHKLFRTWQVMDESILEAVQAPQDSLLPGSLKLHRRAPALYRKLTRGLYPSHAQENAPKKSSSPTAPPPKTGAPALQDPAAKSLSKRGERSITRRQPPRVLGAVENVQWLMGFRLLLLIFAAVILGGIGTAFGAMVGGLLVGIVTEADLLTAEGRQAKERPRSAFLRWILEPGRFSEIERQDRQVRAADIMTTDVATVAPKTPVDEAVRVLLDAGVKRLPVVEDCRVAGIVSRHDLLTPFLRSDKDIHHEIVEDVDFGIAVAQADLRVVNVSNPLTAEVGFDLSGATFGDGNEEVSVFNNGELVPSPSLTLRPGAVSLGTVLGDGRNELELAAPDSDGLLLYGDAVVWAGSNTLEVTVRREGTPAPGVSVTSSLGDDQQVSATKITDPSGIATFENLPDRTIILEATDSENRHGALATTGVAGAVTLDIAGIAPAAATENKDFSCACADGWDGTAPVTVVPHQEGSSPASLGAAAESTVQARPVRSRVRADTSRAQPAAPGEDNDLSISTAGEGPASRSHSFEVDPGTTEISVRYRFVTSEVPGGWCGTKYNDYFNVAIRSKNAGGSISEGDSMNGLGCGAFDASGATAWREASLPVKPVNETTGDTVQVDVTVANVGDDLLDSSVIVDFVEEKTFTIEQLDLNDVDNKDLTHFSTFPAPPDYFGGHANVHGTVRIKGKEDDGVETLELEVVEGGGPVATAELASGAEGALLQDFGDDEKVEVTASQLLFRLAAGEAAGIESSENGTVTLRAKAKSKKGEEDTKEFQAPLPKLTRYVNPNRYGGRDPSEGGDDWVKPSVRTVAEALGGNTYGDFSSMHGGDKCAFGAPPSCTTHKEHKTGNDIDGIFDGYYAPDPTQLANDSCALRGLASPCPKRKVTVAAASTILGVLPIALALGAGAESRMPMGIAIIGGLIVGSVLTLFVIPAMYVYLTGRSGRIPIPDEVNGEGKVVETPKDRLVEV